jgi:hypothetical protein
VGPFLEYLDDLQRGAPDRLVTIILAEFVPARWWQHLLPNPTALLIKGRSSSAGGWWRSTCLIT